MDCFTVDCAVDSLSPFSGTRAGSAACRQGSSLQQLLLHTPVEILCQWFNKWTPAMDAELIAYLNNLRGTRAAPGGAGSHTLALEHPDTTRLWPGKPPATALSL